MQIHCPNCKNTSEAIKNPASYVVFFVITVFLIGGAAGGSALMHGAMNDNLLAIGIGIFFAPLSLHAIGMAIAFAKRYVNTDESARCPICRYPWGVPTTHAPTANKPPLLK